MRASRLVSTVLLLQARERITAEELAREHGVSVRTVYRDVTALQISGIPVYGEGGAGGGYRLVDGYRTQLTGLTPAEAEAMMLIGLPAAAEALGRTDEATTARLKLLAALPEDLARVARLSAELFHLDTSTWYGRGDVSPHLPAIAAAVWDRRLLEVEYERWRAPELVTRTIAPLGLVLKANAWYLVAARAADGTIGSPATYRVSQFRRADPGERFERPDFDLAGYWRRSVTDFERQRMRGLLATLAVTEAGLEALRSHSVTAIAEAAQHPPVRNRAKLTVVVPVESISHGAPILLALGAEVEVLDPPELRAHLTQVSQAMAGLYG